MRRLLLTLAFLLLSLGSYAQRLASVFVEGTLLMSPDRTPLATKGFVESSAPC